MNLARDLDRAIEKIRERIDAIDEALGLLQLDAPGDPGVVVWPRDLQDEIEALHDERYQAAVQLTYLQAIKAQKVA